MSEIIALLAEGDLRSAGKLSEVLGLVSDQPDLFSDVVQAMVHADPSIRIRASVVVEKITRAKPEYLQPHKAFFMDEALLQTQREVRWHVAQLVPRLDLSPEERSRAAGKLFKFLDDPSKIVQTNSLQALVDLAWDDDELFKEVKAAVERLADDVSPASSHQAGRPFLSFEDQADQ